MPCEPNSLGVPRCEGPAPRRVRRQRVASAPVSAVWGIGAGALVGVLAAPFASMIVARPPLLDAKEPLALPFRCDVCAAPLRLADTFPVVSFLMRRGSCRSCGARIPRHQPISEALTIAVSALVGWRVGWNWPLPAHLVLGFVAVCVVLIDYRLHKIPTKLVYPAAAVAAIALLVAAVVDDAMSSFVRAGLGALLASGFLWMLVLFVPAGMGQGDARLSLLVGLLLGWHGWPHIYLGLLAGFLFGSVFGIVLVIAKRLASRTKVREGLKTQIAFGPYLCAGALLFSLWPGLVGQPTHPRVLGERLPLSIGAEHLRMTPGGVQPHRLNAWSGRQDRRAEGQPLSQFGLVDSPGASLSDRR